MMSNEWKMVKLGDVFNLQMGKTPDRNNSAYWNDGANRWISIADIKDAKYISETKETISDNAVCESKIKLIPKETVIMSFKLSIGKVAITKEDMYCNEAIMSFSPLSHFVTDLNFLYYRLLAYDWVSGLNKAVKGVTLNKATLSDTKMIFPVSISRQREIAAVLDKASELVSKRKAQLDELDRLAESIFYDMFGDPVTNEKGFKQDVLKNNLEVIGGYAFKSDQYRTEGIPVLRIGNINMGYIKVDNILFYDESLSLSRYEVYPNDIVISLTGTVGKDDYGNICIVDDSFSKYYLNQRNAKLILFNSLNSRYFTYTLKNLGVKRRLTGVSRGVRQANISNSDIYNLSIPIPSIDLQQQFAERIEKIEEQKTKVKTALKESEELFQRLMQDMFNPDKKNS